MHHSLSRLQYLCNTIPALLEKIPEAEFSKKPAPGKWSKKEILGHLIDSATNNHHRFIRTQFENQPAISYHADLWNDANQYASADKKQLIHFWTAYNFHIIHVIQHMPGEKLQKQCRTGDNTHTLEWLFEDYVVHLEHHLKQIVSY